MDQLMQFIIIVKFIANPENSYSSLLSFTFGCLAWDSGLNFHRSMSNWIYTSFITLTATLCSPVLLSCHLHVIPISIHIIVVTQTCICIVHISIVVLHLSCLPSHVCLSHVVIIHFNLQLCLFNLYFPHSLSITLVNLPIFLCNLSLCISLSTLATIHLGYWQESDIYKQMDVKANI